MTELIWEGKYDQEGRRVAPLRVALPFQTIESVNESVQQRQMMMDLFQAGRDAEWRNRLIWGDKKYLLPSLLEEFGGKVNLIYIDPPFAVGHNFAFTTIIPNNPDTEENGITEFYRTPSVIEMKAYRDTWGRGMDSYLQWLYETLILLREFLTDNGSIFVHIDVHKGPYVKTLMDEIFGIENFQNEIAWYYYNKLHDSRKKVLPKAFDQILYYVKSKNTNYTYHGLKEPREKPVKKLKYKKVEGKIQNVIGEDGKALTYLSEERTIDNVWRIRCLQPANQQEWVNFETQKPVNLIERILSLSSNENDLILDCFCGSGTTAVASERMNRRWITCDLSRFAIHTTRKRLLAVENLRPFVVQNLGKYERQAWQKAEFKSVAGDTLPQGEESVELAYRKFILDLYHAQAINGYNWLHGMKGGRMVHVGGVDAPVSVGDVTSMVSELKRAVGSGKDSPQTNGVDILGWDFAFELNEVSKQQAALANVQLRFMRVPRDVMDKRAVEQGDIHFFELAALAVDAKVEKKALNLTLSDFVIPPDDVPEDVQRAIKHWSQWIDYWAVDWDYREDTFHNQWQTYRTRKTPELQKSASHVYEEAGEYTVVVKVIDILGNDTTQLMKVKVG